MSDQDKELWCCAGGGRESASQAHRVVHADAGEDSANARHILVGAAFPVFQAARVAIEARQVVRRSVTRQGQKQSPRLAIGAEDTSADGRASHLVTGNDGTQYLYGME